MKRFRAFLVATFFIAGGISLGAQSAAAQAWSQPWALERLEKSPRHHEWVTVKHGGRSVELFIAYPESKEKRPVVLIIHEIFGLSDWAQ
jgi:carboxymethylenebutenolidase